MLPVPALFPIHVGTVQFCGEEKHNGVGSRVPELLVQVHWGCSTGFGHDDLRKTPRYKLEITGFAVLSLKQSSGRFSSIRGPDLQCDLPAASHLLGILCAAPPEGAVCLLLGWHGSEGSHPAAFLSSPCAGSAAGSCLFLLGWLPRIAAN